MTTDQRMHLPTAQIRPLSHELVLSVRGLSKSYSSGSSRYDVVSDVSFDLHRGETVGIVGESGCGKTTVARCLLRLENVTAGAIELRGVDLTALRGKNLRRQRRHIQMVFQDPFGSLDPRMTVRALVEQPLAAHGVSAQERQMRAEAVLRDVGLEGALLERRPSELSGGQRQRVAVARAVVLEPDVTVLDEPISALDVSVQAQVLTLLRREQHRLGLTYLFIVHDLAAAEYFCDRVLVLYLGQIVESGSAEDLFRSPQHPYTVSLLSATPDPRRTPEDSRRVLLHGEPTARRPERGCPFVTRCPVGVHREVCRSSAPTLTSVPPDGSTREGAHEVACHFPGELTLSSRRLE